MRRPFISAVGAAAVAGALSAGGGAIVRAAPPDDDDDNAAAIEQFTDLAERSGYTLVDPACSASPESDTDLTFTCYAMTTADGPFIARTTLSPGDMVEFEIIAQPGESVEPAPPPAGPGNGETSETVAFDPLAYFDTMFSGDAAEIATLQEQTAAGSPAEAYALYQLAFAEMITAFGGEVATSHVYLTEDGVLVCVMPSDCVYVTDVEVIDGQLADFSVDRNEIAPRLGRPGVAVTVDPATARVRAAYRSVTSGDALRVYLEVSSSADARFELSKAVYVDSDGNVTPVDTETSIGAIDGSARVPTTVGLDFPGADPGGELRFLVFPRGAAAPVAVVLPVDPVIDEPTTDDI
ncbi:MAG: hypothetical protein K0S92_1376 [Desertimonas sp.]|nr:hypothetical protein [Desertimonas sp.]